MAGHAYTGERRESSRVLEEIQGPIRNHLDAMEGVLVRELASPHAFMKKYIDHLGNYRGKQIRPAVLFYAGLATGDVSPSHVDVAAAAELMHCATLVHDDILDDASIRRRGETVNRKWGNERSVLLGDYIFTKAFEIVQRRKDGHLIGDLIASAQEICLGEMLQIEKRYDFTVDEPFYLSMIGMKTASLFRFCAGAGARLTGADAAQVEALRTFAGNIGIAFQIIDDCLDLVGDEAVVGKSLGSDVEKGKMTLPLIHAYRQTPQAEREELEADFRRGVESPRLQKRLSEHKAVDYAVGRAREYVSEGKRVLDLLPPSPALEQAHRIGDFVLQRKW
jgi:octaprenyl-diphosphate synthase